MRRAQAERKLRDFIRVGWHSVETGEFQGGWHIDAICEHLEAVARRQIKRLIISMPPRHMKSVSSSVFFPAWVWALPQTPDTWFGPATKFLSTSYAQNLAIRDAVRSRRIIDSPWYRDNWGERFKLTSDQNQKSRYENNRAGYRIASAFESVTGDGGDIVIVDDPISVAGAASEAERVKMLLQWDEALQTRLNDPVNGAFIVIAQRTHEKDLTGHILGKEGGSDYVHLCLPARYESNHPFPLTSPLPGWADGDPRERDGEVLWGGRFPDDTLRALEISLGSYAAATQLQQRPAPREGGMFKRGWFNILPAAPARAVKRVRKWDLAATEQKPGTDPDWTVGVRMLKTDLGFYIIDDIVRFRGSPAEVERTILNVASQDGRGVPIRLNRDPGQAGKAQAAALVRMLAGYDVRAELENGSKETRATPLAAQCEVGNVMLVQGPWNKAFLDEIELFPNGAHDDQVDGAAGAFNEITEDTPAVHFG